MADKHKAHYEAKLKHNFRKMEKEWGPVYRHQARNGVGEGYNPELEEQYFDALFDEFEFEMKKAAMGRGKRILSLSMRCLQGCMRWKMRGIARRERGFVFGGR